VLLVAAALAAVAMLFVRELENRTDRFASACRWSATAIALATLGERNLMATPAGQTGISILLVPGRRGDTDDRDRPSAGHFRAGTTAATGSTSRRLVSR
jgi:hypothetical protein